MQRETHPEDLEGRIAAVALRQQGIVGRQQLLAIGLGPEAIRHRVHVGRLHVTFPGAYSVGIPATRIESVRIAALISTAPSFISHRDAGEHYGMLKPIDGPVHVTVAHRRTLRRDGIVIHRTRSLPEADRRTIGALRITSPARTLVDLAAELTPRQLTRAFDESQRLGLVAAHEVLAACRRMGSRPGTPALTRLAAGRSLPFDRTRSPAEARFLRLCAERKLPIPLVNVPLLGFEVDFLWPDVHLVVEFDGSHHDSPSRQMADEARDAALLAAGFSVIRVRSADLRGDGKTLVQRIRARIGDPEAA